MTHTKGQWPDNICSGDIRYARASNYDGFYLADASHGIPTFASVTPTETPTIRGQYVQVFNYPGQTEAIAAQLVHRWNCHKALIEALEEALPYVARYESENMSNAALEIVLKAQAAIDKARATFTRKEKENL